MSEHDFEMGAQAGPSVVEISPSAKPSPFTFDLAAASYRLCSEIEILDMEQAARSGLPATLAQASFSEDPSNVQLDQLFPALTHLASQSGMQNLIIRHFGPILLPVVSSWIYEYNGTGTEAWESRLCFVAGLAAVRPDMWR